ncbi:hypothetical protein J6590_094966 [Homalodisca vitripennis]|nr:hypothetical protein J6590_094966 [Homalodisca vitripennis]
MDACGGNDRHIYPNKCSKEESTRATDKSNKNKIDRVRSKRPPCVHWRVLTEPTAGVRLRGPVRTSLRRMYSARTQLLTKLSVALYRAASCDRPLPLSCYHISTSLATTSLPLLLPHLYHFFYHISTTLLLPHLYHSLATTSLPLCYLLYLFRAGIKHEVRYHLPPAVILSGGRF